MKDFAERLRRESVEWVSRGILSPEQREGIVALYPAGEEHSGRFLAILSTVGGALLGLGAILIIASNWEAIGDWVKIGGLVALLLAAYAAGYLLKVAAGRHPKTGEALLMVGAVLFFAGIALVSQTFHLNARPASGLLIWWLGILAVPWITGSKGAQFVSLAALLSWLGVEITTEDSPLRIVEAVGHSNTFLACCAAFVGFGLALFLSGVGMGRGRFQVFAGLHEKWGLLVLHAALYALGFMRHGYRWSSADPLPRISFAPAVLVLAVVALAAALAWRNRPAEVRPLAPWLLLALVPAVVVAAGIDLGDEGWAWSALSWIALFLLDIALVRAGLAAGREGWVNLAIAFLGVNILTRYFDLFGSMMDSGLLFLTTGALILGLGLYLEKKRRSLIATLREEAVV